MSTKTSRILVLVFVSMTKINLFSLVLVLVDEKTLVCSPEPGPGLAHISALVLKGQRSKARIALNGTVQTTELRDVTCHMGSHTVTCYPTQVSSSRINSSPQAGSRFKYPGGMEG